MEESEVNQMTKVKPGDASDEARAATPTGRSLQAVSGKADIPIAGELANLRAPFAPNHISKLPKPTKQQTEAVRNDFKKGIRCKDCGSWHHPDVVHLDYVGHAALTDRLLDTDLFWSWEPLAFTELGLPAFDQSGGLWIKLTVCGVTRLGYGHAAAKSNADPGSREKEVIGDALRNAAMRFGAALDLWHKGDLHADAETATEGSDQGQSQGGEVSPDAPNDRAARGRNNGPTKSALDRAENEIVHELNGCGDEETLIAYLETDEYKTAKALLEEHRPSALYGPPPADCPEYTPIKARIAAMVKDFRNPAREPSPMEAG
jgi:hypothetical protein